MFEIQQKCEKKTKQRTRNRNKTFETNNTKMYNNQTDVTQNKPKQTKCEQQTNVSKRQKKNMQHTRETHKHMRVYI